MTPEVLPNTRPLLPWTAKGLGLGAVACLLSAAVASLILWGDMLAVPRITSALLLTLGLLLLLWRAARVATGTQSFLERSAWALMICHTIFAARPRERGVIMGELRSFETWIQVSIWLLCLGYALGTLARRPERLRVLRGPAARFTTAFALLCCASTLYAYSPLLTLGWSLKLLTCLTMTVAFIDPSEPLRSIRNLLDGTIMGLTFMLLGFVSLGVLSTGDLEYSAAEADSSRLGGTLMSPNELAAVSGLLLVLCLVRLLKRTRNLPSVAGVLIAGTLLMGSVGRGGIIAACLASLVALALYRSTRLALVLAMVIGLILILFPSTVDYGWTAITRGQNPQALGTLNGRFAIWSAAIDLFIERPLLGWGYVSAAGPFQSQFTHMPPANTHNAFLEAATGVGLVGLLLLGAAVVSTAATLIHLLRAGLKSQEGFNTTVALTSIFLCLLIQGIFESSFTGAPRATAVIFFALPFAADQMRSALRPRHSDMTNPGAVRS